MKKYKYVIIPTIIFLGSFLLRLSLISKGPYHSDCLQLALTSEAILIEKKMIYLQASGLPFVSILGAVFVYGVKHFFSYGAIFAVNLMSVVMSSLSVFVFYFFVKNFFDEKTAFCSAILLSINPIFLASSIYGNSHCPAIFFLLSGFLFLLKYLKTKGKFVFFVASLSFGLMAASRLQDAVFFIPAGIFFFGIMKKNESLSVQGMKKIVKELFFFFLLSSLICIFFYIPLFLSQGDGYNIREWVGAFDYSILKGFVFLNPFFLKLNLEFFVSSVTILGFLIALVGFLFLYKKDKNNFYFLILWFFPSFIFFLNLVYTRPRLFLAPLLAFIVAQGYFFSFLANSRRKVRILLFILFFLSIYSSFIGIYPILSHRHEKALLPDFYRWVGKNTEKNALIIERDNSLFLKHYAKRESMSLPNSIFETDAQRLTAASLKIDAALKMKRPVYATGSGILGYNPDFKYGEFMGKNYIMTFIGHHKIEDWHQGALVSRVGLIPLYKINNKE